MKKFVILSNLRDERDIPLVFPECVKRGKNKKLPKFKVWSTFDVFSKAEGYIVVLGLLFLVLLFTVRFIVEYVKESQGGFEKSLGDVLTTGQWLSIPFVLVGLYFMWSAEKPIIVNTKL